MKHDEAVPVDLITGFIDSLQFRRVFGNNEERIASYYGIIALEALLDSYYEEVKNNEQFNQSIRNR